LLKAAGIQQAKRKPRRTGWSRGASLRSCGHCIRTVESVDPLIGCAAVEEQDPFCEHDPRRNLGIQGIGES
jgi:hypothetical protein